MIGIDQLDSRLVDLGLLIGLLTDSGNRNISVNTDWFSNPVTELEECPTRIGGLLSVIDNSFNRVSGNEYTTLDQNEIWYSIFSGAENQPTGLCLVAPKPGSTSGAISLGVFNRMLVEDLTVSFYACLPLFYLNDGHTPEFIPAGGASQNKKCRIGIEAYSAVPVAGSELGFNLMSAIATLDFTDSLNTTFDLLFYEGFDPATGNKTQITPPTEAVITGSLQALVTQGRYWLASYIGDSAVTVGDLLSASGLVTKNVDSASGETTYSFDQATFDELKTSGPTALLKRFLITLITDLFEPLVSGQQPLLAIEGGGVYVANDLETKSYGLRLAIPDFQITAAKDARAQVTVQLGKGFTNETAVDSWMQRITSQIIEPGIEILFLKLDGTNLSTTSRLALNSIGLDLSGAGDAPLINLDGYTLKGAELRMYLDSDGWKYGFGIRLDDVSFPAGPNFSATQSGSADTNVIAQNILAIPDSTGASASAGAVSPGFSAEAGYISDHDPFLEIYDPEGHKTDLIWFPIQRRLGPIDCQKVGLKIDDHKDDPVLGLVFDGGVALGGLSIYLDQLSIDAHLKQIAHTSGYGFDLQGLDVDFSNGSIEVNAGLLKATDDNGNISYNGEALIKGPNLTLAALGSYASLPNHGGTSMFIFGVLNEPLGGPACFYVTGLMAGFGYNRALKLPDQDKVQEFPLLAGLTNPDAIGGTNPKPADALQKLQDVVPVRAGEYWLAAGVKFTSFKIINTTALIVVEFGNDLTIALLGLSILKQPIVGNAWVYAELGIEVIILPEQGEFKASAVLAPSSYVLTPDAHLTGGFAFYSWFGNSEHSGDFVLTLGGYHPAFNVPSHYPQEPRLGINWQISEHLSMIGTAYFALTPSAMMAGCGLQVTFHDGDLKAWLKMQADIIIFWKPFYVIADISISVGVSYRISLLFTHVTVSAEIGADFHLWGPQIGGTVHIDWYVISFSISFGADKHIPSEIGWHDFKEMLPAKHQDEGTPAYLSIASNSGLLRSHEADGLTLWLVRPSQFQFSTGSAIPASALAVVGPHSTNNLSGIKVGVQRVNGGISPDNYQSQQTVTIVKVTTPAAKNDFTNIRRCMATSGATVTSTPDLLELSDWQIDAVNKNVPQAMWGRPTGEASINADSSTIVAAIGVTMCPKAPVITNCTPEMVIDKLFEDRTVNADDQFMLPLSQTQTPVANAPQDVDSFADIKSVNDAAIYERRSTVFATLAAMGVNAWNNDPLNAMAGTPGKAFVDEPMEGSTVLSS